MGYFPNWMKEAPATDVDRAALETAKKIGLVPTEVHLPDWPYDSLDLILFAEAAAAFEELTLSGKVCGSSKLKCRTPGPTCFARHASYRLSISFRPTACAARWRKKWRVSSEKSTYC